MVFKFNRNEIFSSDGWIPVNKRLSHEVGIEGAIIYGELSRKEKWYSDNDRLHNGGWFFVTHEDLEESTTLKRRAQDRGVKALVDIGLLEKKQMGLPARRFFRLVDTGLEFDNRTNKIDQNEQTDSDEGSEGVKEEENGEKPHHSQFVQNEQTRMTEMNKLDCPNWTGNNNNSNNNNPNKNNKNLYLDQISEYIWQMKVPMPLKKFFSDKVKVLVEDTTFDLSEIEYFYNTQNGYIDADCTQQDVMMLNDVEFTDTMKNMYKKVDRPINNMKGLIKTWVQARIHYKIENEQDNGDY
ncbi:hypothetical protein [Virgibacillus sp. CBA3643]|uniref:hypothetical protein n=1 Tax=Virgibacillus sp. CBA3643 TaxID=2942278 RepID=UPI0035A3943B